MEWNTGTEVGDDGRRFFVCAKCERAQTAKPADKAGGITADEAIEIGWVYDESTRAWVCPLCSGNSAKLAAVFNRGRGLRHIRR